MKEKTMPRIDTVHSPIGPLHLALSGDALCGARFDAPFAGVRASNSVGERLRAYFAGHLGALDDVLIEMNGATFQRRVWEALRAIPPGKRGRMASWRAFCGRTRERWAPPTARTRWAWPFPVIA